MGFSKYYEDDVEVFTERIENALVSRINEKRALCLEKLSEIKTTLESVKIKIDKTGESIVPMKRFHELMGKRNERQ
ncbi:MAG: hypothetical protein LBP62_08575 [Clostridiales bacterium]|jgi:hypothetical protein|nr:hypothetical protein [Clostridiales bacterium]